MSKDIMWDKLTTSSSWVFNNNTIGDVVSNSGTIKFVVHSDGKFETVDEDKRDEKDLPPDFI